MNCPHKRLSFIITVALVFCYTSVALCAISPSQVLVLYNADWTKDAFLTDPGQDSKEIADHYVYMHTDTKTGEKPYILGLNCVHSAKYFKDSHLNSGHLSEESSDNATGVVFKGHNPLKSKSDTDMRDSRLLEFNLPHIKDISWQFDTLRISLLQPLKEAVILVEGGKSRQAGPVAIQKEGKWNVRANGRNFLTGSFTAKASCLDSLGKKHEWEAKYTDVVDVHFTATGPDSSRDDEHYLEDIEDQVKKFLEAPENARPDGTLLKDHILFLVVCYGLPRTTVAPYGIARGITEILRNYGAIISLEQRLQLMYYDVDAVMGTAPQPKKFRSKSPFTAYFFRSPQAKPLYGISANPFMHPLLYNKDKGDLDNLPEPLSYSSETRNQYKNQHLFFVMRIDATTPMEARGLVDRAVYASKYGSQSMDQVKGGSPTKTEDHVAKLSNSPAGNWLWEKGVRHLRYPGGTNGRLKFNILYPEQGFFNQDRVYLPGGITGTVISHNSWNNQEMMKELSEGITVTAGAGRAYGGAPHIHNKSWWDDEILYSFLYKGRTLGEALLMNQVHLGWITTFVGDPLYFWPNVDSVDSIAPEFDAHTDVHLISKKNDDGNEELWLRVDLKNTPDSPETAQLIATSEKGDSVLCQTFEPRPYLKMGELEKTFSGLWHLNLIDPFGNRFQTELFVDPPQ